MTLAIFCWVGLDVASTIAEKTHKNLEKQEPFLFFEFQLYIFFRFDFDFQLRFHKKLNLLYRKGLKNLNGSRFFDVFMFFLGYSTCYNKTNSAEDSQDHKLSF